MKPTVRRVFHALLLLALLLALHAVGVQASVLDPVTIYYNRACADCLRYIEETIVPLLRDAGYTELVYKDYINEPANRVELLDRSEALSVPPSLQSHLTVLIGERLVLEGHIPEGVVADLLTAPADAFDRLVIYQDKMSGATDYVAWGFRGEPQTYAIDAPISEYLAYLAEHGEMLPPATAILAEERALLRSCSAPASWTGLIPAPLLCCSFSSLSYLPSGGRLPPSGERV